MSLVRRVLCCAAAAVATWSVCGAASAEVTFGYRAVPVVAEVGQGLTVDVDLYLVETVTDGSTSPIADGLGLYSVGAQVEQLPSGLIDPPTITSATASASFADAVVTVEPTGDLATFTNFIGLFDLPVSGTVVAPGVTEVFIGTVTIEAGSELGVQVFEVRDDPVFSDTLVDDLLVLDGLEDTYAFAPTTFQVTVVPAPTVASCMLIGLAGLVVRRRRS